jgi:hypothetical protein
VPLRSGSLALRERSHSVAATCRTWAQRAKAYDVAKAESQASGLLLLVSLRERQKRVGGSALPKKERQMLRRQCSAWCRSGWAR